MFGKSDFQTGNENFLLSIFNLMNTVLKIQVPKKDQNDKNDFSFKTIHSEYCKLQLSCWHKVWLIFVIVKNCQITGIQIYHL